MYLYEIRPCAVAKLTRLGTREMVGVEALLPRVLYRYELRLDKVLDLTDPQVREHTGVSVADLTGEEWSLCQTIGTDAQEAGDHVERPEGPAPLDHWMTSAT